MVLIYQFNPLTSQGFLGTPFDFIKRAPSVDLRSLESSVERVNLQFNKNILSIFFLWFDEWCVGFR
jgi:hypothetical protein